MTQAELLWFAHLVIETGFDLLTEYGLIDPYLVARAGALADVLGDYDWALRRLGVIDPAERQRLVSRLQDELKGTKQIQLVFRLSPNTWSRLLSSYAEGLAERWGLPGEPPHHLDEHEDDPGIELDEHR